MAVAAGTVKADLSNQWLHTPFFCRAFIGRYQAAHVRYSSSDPCQLSQAEVK